MLQTALRAGSGHHRGLSALGSAPSIRDLSASGTVELGPHTPASGAQLAQELLAPLGPMNLYSANNCVVHFFG